MDRAETRRERERERAAGARAHTCGRHCGDTRRHPTPSLGLMATGRWRHMRGRTSSLFLPCGHLLRHLSVGLLPRGAGCGRAKLAGSPSSLPTGTCLGMCQNMRSPAMSAMLNPSPSICCPPSLTVNISVLLSAVIMMR
ncbi:unnamed protein product [Spirodela intermedia]|uniref:Uncharacterized protein n=1 Tax=Spirodela intermedia TaxID=51605 RepID=A0A7I8KKR4_SPIIN|nr:unnamed protein product [Spirodela intermedia]